MCGENLFINDILYRLKGSSPLVWGKLYHICISMSTSRIIPTCVGKTQMKVLLVLPKQDHPHLCGENDILKSLRKSKGGSSPLVWGKPTGMLVQGDERRIIPTCVGKTVTSISLPHMIQDHPHLCGENPNALANPYDL